VYKKKKRREKKLEEKNTKKRKPRQPSFSRFSSSSKSSITILSTTTITTTNTINASLPPLQQPIFSHIEKPLSSIFHHRSNSLLLNTIRAISKRKPSCNNHFKQI
jgi:hypothetical protein